jgi:uncharacterized protein YacL
MEHKHDKLKDIMRMAKVEVPFDDFEDAVMMRIEKVEQEKSAVAKTKKYALLFFTLGTLFGLGLNYLLTDLLSSIILNPALKNTLLLLSQILYVFLIVLFCDKVLKLISARRNASI